jgi:hypothetical protein
MNSQQDYRPDVPITINGQPKSGNEVFTSFGNNKAPLGSKTYSNNYQTDGGKTQVKETGYVDQKSNNGVTTTTTYNEVVKTTKSETGDANLLRMTGDNANVYQSGRNVTTTSSTYTSNVPRRISGMGKNIETETRYSNIGQGLTTTTSSTGLYANNLVGTSSNIYNTGSSKVISNTVTNNEGRTSIYAGGKRQSMITKESYLVQENVHEPRVVEIREGEKRIVDIREGMQVTKSEIVTQGETRVVREVEGEHRRQRVSRRAMEVAEETEIEIVKQNKIIEVIKEKPVKVEKYVDVKYDVIVDIPIERTIERERIVDIVVERPIEKIVEIPIEQIIEIPYEKIIEQPVEIQKFVETAVERIVEKPYDVVRENIIWTDRVIDVDERDIKKYPSAQVLPTKVDIKRVDKVVENPRYVENIIEKEVRIPVEMYIEIPKEVIVEKKVAHVIDRPVPVEKIITKEVEVPVENVVYHEVDFIVERPVYIDNIIEKPVPIEKIIEKEIEIEVEHIVEKPVYIDNVIEKHVEHIVQVPVPREEIIEVPIEQIIENPITIERIVERPVEKVVRKSVPVIRTVQKPVEYLVEKVVERKINKDIEVVVNRYFEVPVEKIVEKKVFIERTVEKPKIVEKIIEIPVEKLVENIVTIEKIVEKPVYIETIVEKEVEVIVEKEVQVPVEKIVEVEVEIVTEKPVYREVITEEQIYIETEVDEVVTESHANENVTEHDDVELAREIETRKHEMEIQKRENASLRAQYDALQKEFVTIRSKISSADEQDSIRLKSKYEELKTRLDIYNEQRTRLIRKSHTRNLVKETQLTKDPRFDELKRRLKQLINENQNLVAQITNKGEFIRKSLRRSTFNNAN